LRSRGPETWLFSRSPGTFPREVAGPPLGSLPWAPIAEGALSALLFAASLWVQPFGFLVCLFSPLPIAVAAWRSGRVGAGLAAIAGAAAIWATAGLGAAAVYTLYFVAGGCYLGLACRKGLSPEAMVGGFAAATVLAFGVTLGIQSAQAGVGPMDYLSEGFRQSAGHLRELLRQSDASPDLTETPEPMGRSFLPCLSGRSGRPGHFDGMGQRPGPSQGDSRSRGLHWALEYLAGS